MNDTFKNLKSIAEMYEGNKNDLDLIAIEYQKTKDNVLLAVTFCELYQHISLRVNKYFNLTESDKASFALQELETAMLDFRTGKGAKLKTFYTRYLDRRMYAETNMTNHQKRSANNSCGSFESVNEEIVGKGSKKKSFNMKYTEDGFGNYEMMESLEKAKVLTENEIKYCKIIMRESSIVTDSEVARELSVSPSAINQLKKSLAKKFLNLQICY